MAEKTHASCIHIHTHTHTYIHQVEPASGVTSLSQWLKYYGEPNPDRIKNATMTTFEPISKIVAGGKSQGKQAVTKVDGRTWKQEFDKQRLMVANATF